MEAAARYQLPLCLAAASDAGRGRFHALAAASSLTVSLLLHGSVLAAVLLLVEAKPGASPAPSEAISIEVVASDVLEAARSSLNPEAAASASSVQSDPGAVEDAAAATSERPAAPERTPEVVDKPTESIERPSQAAEPPPEPARQEEAAIEPPPGILERVEEPTSLADEAAEKTADRPTAVETETPAVALDAVKEPTEPAFKQAAASIVEREEAPSMSPPPVRAPVERAKRETMPQPRKSTPMKKGGEPSRAIKQTTASSARVSASPGAARNYAAVVRARVASRKPAGPGRNGTVVVTFGVSRSGGLAFASISRSSGDLQLDHIVLSAVRSAAPFPTPPPGASSGELRFSMPFDFR